MGLISAFSLGAGEHVALVGGGGKTTLLRSLAEELSATGSRVVATTTTKVSQEEARDSPFLVWCSSSREECLQSVRKAVRQHGWIFVGKRPLETHKVEGIPPETATALFRDPVIDHVIVEADGASGRPVKAPAEHEPVIPDSATLTIALMGLEAVGKALGPDIAFRLEQIQEITGLQLGAALSIEMLAKLFGREQGLFRGTPERARRVVFLNKLDVLPQDDVAFHLARCILEESDAGIDRVVIGSLAKATYSTLEGKQ